MIFHHHPDGKILIRGTSLGDMVFSIEEFQMILGEPYVGLPEGCKERIFDMTTGKNVLFTNDDRQIDGGDFPAVVAGWISRNPDFAGKFIKQYQETGA